MIGKGRIKIISDVDPMTLTEFEVIKNVINTAINTHTLNRADISFLMNYKNGQQPILNKIKEIRPEVNNKLVINHAQMVTRMITGYFLGTPIQYTQSSSEKKDEVELLNKFLAYEDKASVDKEIAEYQSICGTAYRVIYTDGLYGDEVPFEDRLLDPLNTFVVYENNVAEKPLLACTYYPMLDENNNEIGTRLFIYTNFGKYTVETKGLNGMIFDDTNYNFEPYSVGGVPIIEYPNNIWRLGDWELCIGLMDAINSLHSGRLDDIDQTVQSLLVFINADIDAEVYEEMRSAGVVVLKNNTNMKSEVQNITTSLDQNGMNLMANELEDLLYALLGIPDRNNRSGGGGDTGTAVELRDGWADLEIVARAKELTFQKSEKQALKIMLNIMNTKTGTTLSLLDIDIKFNRNKNNNLLVKTQAYMNLMSTKTLAPEDCLTIVDLVSDVNDFIERGKTFWGDNFANKQIVNKIANNIENNDNSENKQSENTKNEDNKDNK